MAEEDKQGEVHRLRRDALDWLEVDDGVIALDADKSVYISTNESGAGLWQALVEGATREQLAGQLVAEYGIEMRRASADVDAFLAMAREQDLLEA